MAGNKAVGGLNFKSTVIAGSVVGLSAVFLVLLTKYDLRVGFFSPKRSIDQTRLTRRCVNDNLKISVNLLEGWQCDTSTGYTYPDGWILLKSDVFDVTISNLGRGPYCNDGEDMEDCKVNSFYRGASVALSSYRYKNQNKELFGGLTFLPNVWVSVKYKGMEFRDLTPEERTELIEALIGISKAN